MRMPTSLGGVYHDPYPGQRWKPSICAAPKASVSRHAGGSDIGNRVNCFDELIRLYPGTAEYSCIATILEYYSCTSWLVVRPYVKDTAVRDIQRVTGTDHRVGSYIVPIIEVPTLIQLLYLMTTISSLPKQVFRPNRTSDEYVNPDKT